jgi:hypothetical protein
MGNRGCLHDDEQRIRRPFACRRWIICVLESRGRYRTVMSPGRYTELFFLDEATALAAGHRPCAECQHGRYLLFRDLWHRANPGLSPTVVPSADEMDRILHAERLEEARRKRTYRAAVGSLPPGTMIADDNGIPHLVLESELIQWEPYGYTRRVPRPTSGMFSVLTPRSIVGVLASGYPVAIHPSAARSV